MNLANLYINLPAFNQAHSTMLKKGNILQILRPAGFDPMSTSHRQESGRVHSNQGPPAFIFRTGNYEKIY